MKMARMSKMSEQDRLRVAVKMTMQNDGLSFRQFATLIASHHAEISKILNGNRDARMSTWERMAAALNTTIRDLLDIPVKTLLDFEAIRQVKVLLPRKPRGYGRKVKSA